jgi:hypothetical protein
MHFSEATLTLLQALVLRLFPARARGANLKFHRYRGNARDKNFKFIAATQINKLPELP